MVHKFSESTVSLLYCHTDSNHLSFMVITQLLQISRGRCRATKDLVVMTSALLPSPTSSVLLSSWRAQWIFHPCVSTRQQRSDRAAVKLDQKDLEWSFILKEIKEQGKKNCWIIVITLDFKQKKTNSTLYFQCCTCFFPKVTKGDQRLAGLM